MKKVFGVLFMLIGIILIFSGFDFNITGNLIKDSFSGKIYLLHFLGLMFFIGGLILFIAKKSLDYLIIPTAGESIEDIRRAKRAEKEKANYYLISGIIDKPIKESSTGIIYKELRKRRIKPSEMIIEGKSKDSLENFLYSIKKLKEKEEKQGRKIHYPVDVGISTYSGHLDRFKDFEKEAIKEGIIKKGEFKFHKLKMPETDYQKNYEDSVLRKILHKYKLFNMKKYKTKDGKIKYVKKKDPIMNFARKVGGFFKKD